MLTFLAVLVVLALQIVILVQVMARPGENWVWSRSNTAAAASKVALSTKTDPQVIVPTPDEAAQSPPSMFYTVAPDCQVRDLPRIYETVFGQKATGTFVEFGAFDGATVSNTCGLADLGWRGVYIEPVPQYAAACRQRHRANARVTVVECAIGPESRDAVTLNVGGALSTMDPVMLRAFKTIDWAKPSFEHDSTINVPQRLLHDVLTEHAVAPGFELMVVDIEGYEWDALRNFDLSVWQPTMVIIELEDSHHSFMDADPIIREKFSLLKKYFFDAGYVIIYKDFINTIYVKHTVLT